MGMPSASVTRSWAPEYGFLADDQAHPHPPARQAVPGEFGDPGAIADLAARFDGGCPGRCLDLQYGMVDGVGDGHADRVGRPPAARGEPVEELAGAAAGVGADQGAAPAPVGLGALARAS